MTDSPAGLIIWNKARTRCAMERTTVHGIEWACYTADNTETDAFHWDTTVLTRQGAEAWLELDD